MTADTLKTIRWLIVAAALVAVAIGCRPEVHFYLHHDVTFPQLPDLPIKRNQPTP